MTLNLSAFKKLTKEFSEAAKHVKNADVVLEVNRRNYWSQSNPTAGVPEEDYTLNLSRLHFKNVDAMYRYCKYKSIPIDQLKCDTAATFVGALDRIGFSQRTLRQISDDDAREFKSLKLLPNNIPAENRPFLVKYEPVETTAGNYTYRFLLGSQNSYSNTVTVVGRNDEPLYDYLDKGFFLMPLTIAKGTTKTNRVIVSDTYDVHTAHIFMMCSFCPSLADMLRQGHFISSYDAEMLRLKMLKKMPEARKKEYLKVAGAVDTDYHNNTTLIVVGKLIAGDVEKTTINNVTFTKNSATYENVSIEAEGLLDLVYSAASFNFNSEFDIYTIVDLYGKHIRSTLKQDKEPVETKAEGGLILDEHVAELENPIDEEDEDNTKKKKIATFKVNGIEITPSISTTGQRYLNDVRINKEEIDQAIYRASCHKDAANYKLFLKSVSRMSIKYHDIIANGLKVKIHDSMTRDEMYSAEPGPAAPALKFHVDPNDKYIKISVADDRGVRVSLGRLIGKVRNINKKTNGKLYYEKNTYRGKYRNHEWSREMLITALVESCTFKTKVSETVVDEEGNEQIKTSERTDVLITRDDIIALMGVANERKKAALERSKEFLNTAVKITGAEQITFMDKPAYKVKGSLREYAVVIETAKVYDYETKQYRCIVNSQHYAGTGYDDIAARLLALKNDSMMQNEIGTLAGAAQPAAENVHNDYAPLREVAVNLEEAAYDKAIEKALAS
jgi:hypothetical protein